MKKKKISSKYWQTAYAEKEFENRLQKNNF